MVYFAIKKVHKSIGTKENRVLFGILTDKVVIVTESGIGVDGTITRIYIKEEAKVAITANDHGCDYSLV